MRVARRECVIKSALSEEAISTFKVAGTVKRLWSQHRQDHHCCLLPHADTSTDWHFDLTPRLNPHSPGACSSDFLLTPCSPGPFRNIQHIYTRPLTADSRCPEHRSSATPSTKISETLAKKRKQTENRRDNTSDECMRWVLSWFSGWRNSTMNHSVNSHLQLYSDFRCYRTIQLIHKIFESESYRICIW